MYIKETFVLLPGWLRAEKSYKKLIASAPANLQVIVIRYEDVVQGGNITQLIPGLLKFLEKRDLSKVTLVGHSLGGALSIEFTKHHPEKVEQLILVDSSGIDGHKNPFEVIWSILCNFIAHKYTKMPELLSTLPRLITGFPLYFRLGLYAHQVNLENEARKIKIPTIIIWGEEDVVTPLWQGEKLHQLVSNSKFIVLKSMDHDWITHSPENFWLNIN